MKNNLLTLFSMVGLTAFAALGYLLQSSFSGTEKAPRATMQAGCDLHISACSAFFLDGKKATLSLTPKTIPLLKPINAELTLEGLDAKSVQLNIVGLNMNMGINHNTLTHINKQLLTGKIILPICSTEKMQWEAQAIIHTTNNKTFVAPFNFSTSR